MKITLKDGSSTEYSSPMSVIDIAKDYYASDAFPLGGAHIVHYEDAFYEECCKEISEILKI